MIIYDLHENTIKKLDKTGGLLSTKIWDLKTDRYGNIWVGSDSGISIIDPGRTKVKYLRESEGLVNNQVWTIGTFANGEIWIGTQKGISIIDTGQTKITNLTANEGLVPDAIYNILELNGHTYAATSNGLVMVKRPSGNGNKQHWNFFNYEKRQGLLFNNYNTNAGTITKSGKIWLGAIPELNIINEPPLIDSVKPQVYITGVNIMDQSSSFTDRASVFDHLQAGDSIWDQSKNKYYLKNTFPVAVSYPAKNNIHWDSTEGIFNIPVGLTLPFDQNSISFSFANMNISGRDKIMYRYILEGIDNKWSNADPKNSTKIYYNLAPGKYTFRVSTKDFNGQWSKTAGFDFTIRPPWWQTWWAYLLYVLAAVFIITAYSQYRSRNLRNKNIELEDKISQRTSELKNSLDELKSTQSQLIQSEKMASLGELTAGIAHEIQNPLNFVNNFSDVNKELLDELKEEAGKGNMNEVIALANDVIANEEKINHHGKRADAIVKGMLQHSRSSSGQKEPTNINALADEYFRLAYHGLRAKDKSFNATLKTDYDESIGNINIIPQDIGRVILNLITNAFYAVTEKAVLAKASADKYEPTVSISTKKNKRKSGTACKGQW
ncbi:MAG: triple tyrosine motif-containing protein [Bacteroidota bacterium]